MGSRREGRTKEEKEREKEEEKEKKKRAKNLLRLPLVSTNLEEQ